MQLVLLALQVFEKTSHTRPFVLALKDVVFLSRSKVLPGHVERNSRCASIASHLGRQRPVFRLGPGFNRAVCQRQRLVWYHQVQVEVDGVTKALALRTRAIRIVERKQPWLRLVITSPIVFALKTHREAKTLHWFLVTGSGLEDHFAGFSVCLLDGINQPRPDIRRYRKPADDAIHMLCETNT